MALERDLKEIKTMLARRQTVEDVPASPSEFAAMLGFDADRWQQRVLDWTGKRLLLNCARQSGKSTIASLLAVHQALSKPRALVILVSPSLRQSSELFRKCAQWFDRMKTPPAMLEDNKLSATFANGSRIVSLPASESTIRGFSAVDLLIEDEAARVDDELYKAVRPMLAVSVGRLILASTPWGQRGHFYDEWRDGGDGWARIQLSAIDNPRISPEFLEEERRALGDAWFRSEYLCEFTDTTNNVFRSEDIRDALSGDTPYIPVSFGG